MSRPKPCLPASIVREETKVLRFCSPDYSRSPDRWMHLDWDPRRRADDERARCGGRVETVDYRGAHAERGFSSARDGTASSRTKVPSPQTGHRLGSSPVSRSASIPPSAPRHIGPWRHRHRRASVAMRRSPGGSDSLEVGRAVSVGELAVAAQLPAIQVFGVSSSKSGSRRRRFSKGSCCFHL